MLLGIGIRVLLYDACLLDQINCPGTNLGDLNIPKYNACLGYGSISAYSIRQDSPNTDHQPLLLQSTHAFHSSDVRRVDIKDGLILTVVSE